MMKNLKNLFPVLALVLGIGLVFTQSAFKGSKKDVLRYQYENSTATDIELVDSWNNVTDEPAFECEEGANLPCIIEIDPTDVENPTLEQYLENHDNLTDIMLSPEVKETKSF